MDVTHVVGGPGFAAALKNLTLRKARRLSMPTERTELSVFREYVAEAGPLTVNNPTTLINMLSYALIFLIVAILAGVLGFGVVAGTAATIAKVCFVVFIVLFLFSLLSGRKRL